MRHLVGTLVLVFRVLKPKARKPLIDREGTENRAERELQRRTSSFLEEVYHEASAEVVTVDLPKEGAVIPALMAQLSEIRSSND